MLDAMASQLYSLLMRYSPSESGLSNSQESVEIFGSWFIYKAFGTAAEEKGNNGHFSTFSEMEKIQSIVM
jgi:hypothetical protein